MAIDKDRNPKHHGRKGQRALKMERVIAGCFGKASYGGHDEAARVIRRTLKAKLRHRKEFDAERLSPYRCRTCGHWHIGNGVRRSGDHKAPAKGGSQHGYGPGNPALRASRKARAERVFAERLGNVGQAQTEAAS